jgi:hypothetical protein
MDAAGWLGRDFAPWDWVAFAMGAFVFTALIALLLGTIRFAPNAPRWARWPLAVGLTVVLATVAIWFVSSRNLSMAVGGASAGLICVTAYRLRYGQWWDED